MKKQFATFVAIATLSVVSLGCGPRPIVEERVQETPAVEVDVKPDAADESTGVDVQVGGGQGVRVETGTADQ